MHSLSSSTLFTAFLALSSANALDRRNAFAAASNTPSTCSSLFAECTGSAKIQQVTSYCAALLGTPVAYTATTKTLTVAPTCGTPATGAALRKRSPPPNTTNHPLCFTASNSAAASNSCACFSLPLTVTVTTQTKAKFTGPFSISASGGQAGPSQYAVVEGTTGQQYLVFGDDSSPGQFLLGPDGSLVDLSAKREVAYENADSTGDATVALAAPGSVGVDGYQPVLCSLQKSNCFLECAVNGVSNNYQCGSANQWSIGSDSPSNSLECSSFQPVLVP